MCLESTIVALYIDTSAARVPRQSPGLSAGDGGEGAQPASGVRTPVARPSTGVRHVTRQASRSALEVRYRSGCRGRSGEEAQSTRPGSGTGAHVVETGVNMWRRGDTCQAPLPVVMALAFAELRYGIVARQHENDFKCGRHVPLRPRTVTPGWLKQNLVALYSYHVTNAALRPYSAPSSRAAFCDRADSTCRSGRTSTRGGSRRCSRRW